MPLPVTAPSPVVVVGAGLAGLLTAARLAPLPVLVLDGASADRPPASAWAQGGLAAAVGPDDDPALHAADTLAAGAGLCEPQAVEAITAQAPAAVEELVRLGARLDREPSGALALGLEGAHGRRRIVHARGDGTGAELLRVATQAAHGRPGVTVRAGTRARRVLTDEQGVCGLVVEDVNGLTVVPTRHVALATGGLGGLYARTTNPLGNRGQGLALAARAGASLRDVELVQFHPTALDVGADPMPLVSEAVRGAGATLVDADGVPVLDDPLAARDVVSRAVWAALRSGRRVHLDARQHPGAAMASAFPAVVASCRAAGLDPATDLLPVRPAAHYHMGGVAVDLAGRTDVPGLHAVGECASTGLHGANRLASNSLLEAVVCSGWLADDLRHGGDASPPPAPTVLQELATCERVRTAPGPDDGPAVDVRRVMDDAVGVLRDGDGLAAALALLTPRARHDDAALVAALVTCAALRRVESRGGHTRTDAPATEAVGRHTLVTLADVVVDDDRKAPSHA